MKKLSYLLVPLIVLLCSCGGADKGMNKYYHIPDNHPQTGKAIKMIKNEYIKFDEPYYSIVRYTDLCEDTFHIVSEYNKKDSVDGFYCIYNKRSNREYKEYKVEYIYKYMIVQLKDNKEDTIFTKTFYFDKNLEFWTVDEYTLDYELKNKYEEGKYSWEYFHEYSWE